MKTTSLTSLKKTVRSPQESDSDIGVWSLHYRIDVQASSRGEMEIDSALARPAILKVRSLQTGFRRRKITHMDEREFYLVEGVVIILHKDTQFGNRPVLTISLYSETTEGLENVAKILGLPFKKEAAIST